MSALAAALLAGGVRGPSSTESLPPALPPWLPARFSLLRAVLCAFRSALPALSLAASLCSPGCSLTPAAILASCSGPLSEAALLLGSPPSASLPPAGWLGLLTVEMTADTLLSLLTLSVSASSRSTARSRLLGVLCPDALPAWAGWALWAPASLLDSRDTRVHFAASALVCAVGIWPCCCCSASPSATPDPQRIIMSDFRYPGGVEINRVLTIRTSSRRPLQRGQIVSARQFCSRKDSASPTC